MKRFAILSATTVIIGSCASAAVSDEMLSVSIPSAAQKTESVTHNLIKLAIHMHEEATLLEAIAIEEQKVRNEIAEKTRVDALHRFIIEQRIDELKQYVGKTWYVFSGSTPRGWDCSGLVVWFYEGLGTTLPHSATKQGMLKPKVKDPIPGDIVVTKYKNSKNFIHSGIYIGDNKMIHSGFKSGQRTEVISLDDPSFDNQKHYFVRVIGD